MGVVFEAYDERLNRPAAVKMILTGGFASPEERLRFRLEAEMAGRTVHPDVVRVYAVGEHDGRPYLATEWVAGETLESRLRRERPTPRLAARLARAVQAAHAVGVHRDLKPGNVLLRSDGWEPSVADFGLARPAGEGCRLTAPGAWLGTPEYMAPEQAAGASTPAVDVPALVQDQPAGCGGRRSIP